MYKTIFLRYLISFLKLPFKFSQKIIEYFSYLQIRRKPDVISDVEFKKIINNDIDFLFKLKGFDVDIDNINEITGILKNKTEIIINAEKICEHKFNIWGSKEKRIGYNIRSEGVEGYNYFFEYEEELIKKINLKNSERIRLLFKNKISITDFELMNNYNYQPIDWHIDFKSGYVWDKKLWYKKIRYGQNAGADIKVPWELSRFNHLITIGQAYLLTKDEKYTIEFIFQLIDWIENNKPQYGVNWSCTMDVAIRTCNLIIGLFYFRSSRLLCKDFIIFLSKSLFIHALHIFKNLEKSFFIPGNNHYISNLTGLVYSGIFFNKTKPGKKWLDFAIKELNKEIKKQVYDDGCNFEASTCYHRLVLELFFYSALILIKNDKSFSGKNADILFVGERLLGKNYMDKLWKMFNVVKHILKPDGKVSQIGDNDNGRLHVFSGIGILDLRYLLNLGAVFFNDAEFKIEDSGFLNDSIWVYGIEGYKTWDSLAGKKMSDISSKGFIDSGWYILRKNSDFMLISAGVNGQNDIGGHAHNDKLSFELFYNGSTFIIDPGTYLYTPMPQLRNFFRSTDSHNTIKIDGQEQNRFTDKKLFSLKNDASIKINSWISNERLDLFDAEHYGYKRLKNPVIHRRQIFYDKNYRFWCINDILNGKGLHLVEILFHLSDDIICEKDDNKIVLSKKNGHKSSSLIMDYRFLIEGNFKVDIIDGLISRSYGEKSSSKIIRFQNNLELPDNHNFLICAGEDRDKIDEFYFIFKSYNDLNFIK